MGRPQRVAVITGTRAEYGLLRTVIHGLQRVDGLQTHIIAAGQHLLRRFGYTVQDISADGLPIDARVPMYTGRDEPLEQAQALARGVTGMAFALQRLRSDVVLVLGDRVEALAGALAAVTSGRCLAHIHGGDLAPGHIDDTLRHAITKLAHVHFAACPASGRRICRLGEDPRRVHVVGAPGLDELRGLPAPPSGWLAQRFQLDPRSEVAIILQHPIGRPAAEEGAVMQRIIRAVLARRLSCLILHPNCDPGHSGILQAITQAGATVDRRRLASVASLPRLEFLRCLRGARLLVGNSSCGIIEAHTAGTLAVDIGLRQRGRTFNKGAVLHCGESAADIRSALQQALRLRLNGARRNVYGDGRCGERIAGSLAELDLSDNLLRKTLHERRRPEPQHAARPDR
jgi:UDP-hydrolysing UDP-N-acetyl-D-glucosamine 2-epimerase